MGLTGLAAILVEGGFQPHRRPRRIRCDPSLASARAAQIIGARLVLALSSVLTAGWIQQRNLPRASSEVAPLTWWFAGSLFFLAFKQDWLLQSFERMRTSRRRRCSVSRRVRPRHPHSSERLR